MKYVQIVRTSGMRYYKVVIESLYFAGKEGRRIKNIYFQDYIFFSAASPPILSLGYSARIRSPSQNILSRTVRDKSVALRRVALRCVVCVPWGNESQAGRPRESQKALEKDA